MFERKTFEVSQEQNKMRLDDFLFEKIPALSRMYLRELIKTERCEVNGAFENAGHKLRRKDFIEVEFDASRGTAMRPENIPLDIIYEDSAIVVVNKPAGMLVHPTHRDKNGTLLNALTFYLNQESSSQTCNDSAKMGEGRNGVQSEIQNPKSKIVRAGLVHRLDRQTSGLMVVAKTVPVHRVLAEHFKRKLVEKRYIALVDGTIKQDEGFIEAPIGRYADLKLWNVKHDGKHAKTRFLVRQRNADTTLTELEPITGRTNQLRIHCASIGHPIVGDVGRGGSPFQRLCLHAYKLSFKHPLSSEVLAFEIQIPPEFMQNEQTENSLTDLSPK